MKDLADMQKLAIGQMGGGSSRVLDPYIQFGGVLGDEVSCLQQDGVELVREGPTQGGIFLSGERTKGPSGSILRCSPIQPT